MKFNVEVDLENIYNNEDFYEEFKTILAKEVVKEVAQQITRSWDFDRLRTEIKKEMSADIMKQVLQSVESKKEFYERVFKVKDFSEVTKANEDYLIELMDKVIARRFK